MIGLGILIGALGLLVLEALGAIVLYVVWLRASNKPGRPPAYTIATVNEQRAAAGLPAYAGRPQPPDPPDDLSDGKQPVSPALADWADAQLRAAGLIGLHVSRRFAPLRLTPHHVAFWAADELAWLRLGLTFVSVDDVALVNQHAPLPADPIEPHRTPLHRALDDVLDELTTALAEVDTRAGILPAEFDRFQSLLAEARDLAAHLEHRANTAQKG